MTHLSSTFKLTATSLAVTLMLAACGGGDAEPPPDLIPPTVAITDSVDAAVATGDVTFTFPFSESVGSSFVADDVTVAGGSKGCMQCGNNTVSGYGATACSSDCVYRSVHDPVSSVLEVWGPGTCMLMALCKKNQSARRFQAFFPFLS